MLSESAGFSFSSNFFMKGEDEKDRCCAHGRPRSQPSGERYALRKGSVARRLPTSGFSLPFNLFFFFFQTFIFSKLLSRHEEGKDIKAEGLSFMAVTSDLKAVGRDHIQQLMEKGWTHLQEQYVHSNGNGCLRAERIGTSASASVTLAVDLDK